MLVASTNELCPGEQSLNTKQHNQTSILSDSQLLLRGKTLSMKELFNMNLPVAVGDIAPFGKGLTARGGLGGVACCPGCGEWDFWVA